MHGNVLGKEKDSTCQIDTILWKEKLIQESQNEASFIMAGSCFAVEGLLPVTAPFHRADKPGKICVSFCPLWTGVGTGTGGCHFSPKGVWYTEKAGHFSLIYIGRT